MTTEKAEQTGTQQVETSRTSESDQKLQTILAKFSTEEEVVSPEKEEPKPATEKLEEARRLAETAKEGEKEELPADLTSRIQAEVDKRLNNYRERREADTAYIRSLNTQIKELKGAKMLREGDKLIESILGADAEAGIASDQSTTRETALKEFNNRYKEYKERSLDLEEAAETYKSMTEKLPQNVVREFGLDDANPLIRAVNGAKFLDDTVAVYQYTENFLLAMEDFLPRGTELRQQIEDIVQGLAEFKDERSKKLYLKDRFQGIKATPRNKPKLPSDVSGGGAPKLRGDAALVAGLKEEREKLKIS